MDLGTSSLPWDVPVVPCAAAGAGDARRRGGGDAGAGGEEVPPAQAEVPDQVSGVWGVVSRHLPLLHA